jgi:hypothetical protein
MTVSKSLAELPRAYDLVTDTVRTILPLRRDQGQLPLRWPIHRVAELEQAAKFCATCGAPMHQFVGAPWVEEKGFNRFTGKSEDIKHAAIVYWSCQKTLVVDANKDPAREEGEPYKNHDAVRLMSDEDEAEDA